jgi:outer membrane scaffolding protein for murein synthesis (MipA/OmpV family)
MQANVIEPAPCRSTLRIFATLASTSWATLAMLTGGTTVSRADTHEEPLWEYGLGAGLDGFQAYPGSSTTHVYPFPVVRIVYNGSFFKADQNGARGLLVNNSFVELNISGDGTPPVNNVRVRYGMPELRSTVEIGPAVKFHVIPDDYRGIKLDLYLPVRKGLTLSTSPRSVGWEIEPQMDLRIRNAFHYPGWTVDVSSGPMFADRRYLDYFYSVAPNYATALRPAYSAPGGYAGTQVELGLTKRFTRLRLTASLHYDDLRGAAWLASPLVERSYDWSASLSFAWMLGRSSTVVQVPN